MKITDSSIIQLQLRLLYGLTVFLCLFMIIWILIFPANVFIGRSQSHEERVQPWLDPPQAIHKEAYTKYVDHPLVQVTHILPSVLWSALIPLQLHNGFRKANLKWHKLAGYTFFACVGLVAFGLLLIFQRDLTFEKTFEDLPDPALIPTTITIPMLGVYYVFSAACAWYWIAGSSQQSFRRHQRWMIRHVASGIWVALQRILMLTVYTLMFPIPVSRYNQKRIFGDAGVIGVLIAFALGEYAVYLLDRAHLEKTAPQRKVA